MRVNRFYEELLAPRARALICSFQVKMNAFVLCVHNIVAFQSKRIKRRAICSPDMLIFFTYSCAPLSHTLLGASAADYLCKNNAKGRCWRFALCASETFIQQA
jgi:hypothetical protein